ncbi:proton channel OtopLc-like [Nilaparvata lugens]|uniref:proton channel OtopLc-like n=1 Tax=Nilaparvata lugens TaxID=108931 RepID=UPI00193E5A9A|nr:proton channel OtopLc-like [Nilaparvata lugens]
MLKSVNLRQTGAKLRPPVRPKPKRIIETGVNQRSTEINQNQSGAINQSQLRDQSEFNRKQLRNQSEFKRNQSAAFNRNQSRDFNRNSREDQHNLSSCVYEEVYNEQPERDSLNGPMSVTERDRERDRDAIPDLGASKPNRHKLRPSKTFMGFLSSGRSDMLEHTEPFCYLWVLLSSLYGKLLIILMIAFTLIESMDNSVKLLSLQGLYLMYLYVGSIAVIICIYIWVLVDSCASFSGDADVGITTSVITDAELGSLSLTRFGSLKRAHISRDKTSATSFYLRVGALAFGLGTLVFNGLEMAMHSMMEGACLNDVVFVHPVLHGLFTFLQMHFLFVNSQVLVEKFGLVARFGFMHLAATNLALWARLVIWESGMEWTYFVHLAQTVNSVTGQHGVTSRSSSPFDAGIPTPLQLKGFPRSVTMNRVRREAVGRGFNASWAIASDLYRPISESHISQVVELHQCLNTNSLGQLWTSSMPFLYPFIVQFSLIAAGVTYVMGKNVGRDRIRKLKPAHTKRGVCMPHTHAHTHTHHHHHNNNNNNNKCSSSCLLEPRYNSGSQIDCAGSSKGLFMGLLCLVAGIVVIIIFLVVKEDEGFPTETLFWMTSGTLGAILAISLVMTIIGLAQVRKLSHSGRSPTLLDSILSSVTLAGVQLYSVFGLLVGASTLVTAEMHSQEQRQHIMLVIVSGLQLLQSCAQSTLIGEALRRVSITRHQLLTKPGRQVITFLLCCNATLWAFDSFVTQSWLSQELQLRFLGVLAWGVLSRISLPLLVFYRFHSGVLLLEVWQRAYRNGRLDSGN